MKLSLAYRQELQGLTYPFGGFIIAELEHAYALIVGGYNSQHNADDTHGTITASGPISERGRTTPMGDAIQVAFSAATYTASGGMTWTVTAAQQVTLSYTLIGSTLTLTYWIDNSTLTAPAGAALRIALPLNATAAAYAIAAMHYNNGGAAVGYASITPGDQFLSLNTSTGGNWATASTASVHGQISIPIVSSTLIGAPPADPILTYSGSASGSVNLNAVSTVAFAAGTYTITVNRPVTMTFKGSAGGGGGGNGGGVAAQIAGGGGGGGATTTGTTVALTTSKTYTLSVGAGGAGSTNGTVTTFVNTTDAVTLVSLNAGGAGQDGAGGAGGGAGGALVTGTNGVTGGSGGAGGGNSGGVPIVGATGINATNGSAGAGGGGGSNGASAAAGGAGGTGSVAGQSGGAASGASGGVGGDGGGSSFTSVSGAYGNGGGGAGAATGAGRTGANGVGVFIFVSAP